MLFILDRQERIINILKNGGTSSKTAPYFDDLLSQDLATGTDTYKFSTIINENTSNDLSIGNYVAFRDGNKYKLFQIMQTEEVHDEALYVNVYCECAGLELINKILRKVTIPSASLKVFLKTILDGSGWEVGLISATNAISIDLDIETTTIYSAIQNILPQYGVEWEFRVEINNGRISKKYIDTFKTRGRITGKRFIYGRNIENVIRNTDSTELYTALIGEGNNGITFKDISSVEFSKPAGQDFVGDETAFNRYNNNGSHIMGLFKYDTDSPEELLLKTYEHLQTVKNPKVDYEVNVSLLDFVPEIGDTVSVIDNWFNPPMHLMARVSKLETSKTNPQEDKCVLANYVEVKSSITNEMREIASKLEGAINSRFPIKEEDISDGAVTADKIDDAYTEKLTTDILEAGKVITGTLIAEEAKITNAEIEKLKAKDIETENIIAKKADIEDLKVVNANIENLKSKDAEIENALINKANIIDLNVTNANIENLKAKDAEIDNAIINNASITSAQIESLRGLIATIDNIISGNVVAGSGQVINLTSENTVIEDALIKDAMIDNVNASKINAGKINTSNVSIESEDGSIIISGNTQQFKDKNGIVRIQMGEDLNGNFSFTIFDETGKGVLIDSTGIKEGAISNGLIKNDMIGDGEINGKKIDINSMITEINDNGDSMISGSKVLLDTKGQSLEIAFNTITTTTEENKNAIDDINSNKMYRIEVISSDGNIFKNGNIKTELSARLYSWDKNITDEIDSSRFIWTRVSSDVESDKLWNEAHSIGSKSIIITSDDVNARATFNVEVLDENGKVII